MDTRTREALEASIKHWEENAVAETFDDASIDAGNCALCIYYFDSGNCTDCPVKIKTGKSHCDNTPYGKAWDALDLWRKGLSVPMPFHEAARAEVKFLKSLRPVETE